jgi:NitT/TauT family transport system substrate-binding protein
MIGWVSPDVLILTKQPGRDHLPLKFFYNGSRTPPWEFAVLDSSTIKTLADLRGKKIGVGSLSFGNVPITKAILRELGMEDGRDYQLVPVGAGSAAYLALQRGVVDCLNLFDAAHAGLEVTGVKLRRLAQPPQYANITAHGFMTHDDNLTAHPNILAGFGRAFAKATVACDAAPRQCVENFWHMFPNLKPSDGTEEKKMADAITILRYGMRKYLVFDGPKRWGSYTDQGLKNAVNALYAGGQITDNRIAIGDLYTNQFVDQFNDFDAAKVAADAKALP